MGAIVGRDFPGPAPQLTRLRTTCARSGRFGYDFAHFSNVIVSTRSSMRSFAITWSDRSNSTALPVYHRETLDPPRFGNLAISR